MLRILLGCSPVLSSGYSQAADLVLDLIHLQHIYTSCSAALAIFAALLAYCCGGNMLTPGLACAWMA